MRRSYLHGFSNKYNDYKVYKMTYQNRMLTTPIYINKMDTAFWNLVASDTASKIKEACPHTGKFMNMSVCCYPKNQRIYCSITCKKCDQVFEGTERVVRDMIGYYGF